MHAPYFPDEKQEYWWVYVCVRKNKGLVTAPFQVTDLVTEAEVELKFTAPKKPGLYTFTVVLRSDAYLGFDQTRDIKVRCYVWTADGFENRAVALCLGLLNVFS